MEYFLKCKEVLHSIGSYSLIHFLRGHAIQMQNLCGSQLQNTAYTSKCDCHCEIWPLFKFSTF